MSLGCAPLRGQKEHAMRRDAGPLRQLHGLRLDQRGGQKILRNALGRQIDDG
jgi:hypothetical protein